MKKTVYEIAKENILKKLEDAEKKGIRFNWVKPWNGGIDYPCSYEKSIPYRGINQILLDAGEYITYKKILELQKKNPEIRLRENARTFPVFYFSYPELKESEEDNKKKKYVFRYYRVFNISDVENIETKFPYKEKEHTTTENTERADRVILEYCKRENILLEIIKGSSQAVYSPVTDRVRIPDKGQYESLYEFYSTCFHELVHSTAKKLGRDMTSYAKEELIAEIGASMLCCRFHIMDDSVFDNNVAYIQNWSRCLKEEKGMMIVSAACQAQKACDLIMNEVFSIAV